MNGFKYITINDLTSSIRRNIHKIPHDIDLVIGVPRSGMIPASIIAEYLNVKLIDLESFIKGCEPCGGDRMSLFKERTSNKVLVIDDTVFSGKAMIISKLKLKPFENQYNFIYAAAFLEGPAFGAIDLYIKDLREYTNRGLQVIYEWNIFNHWPHIAGKIMWDFDGVFCLDPPDDRNEEEYQRYIKNAIPLFTPKVKLYKIVTYRIEKNREVSENWLKEQNIDYQELIMFNAQNTNERNCSGISPEVFKANFYKNDANALLYIESDDYQARRIHEISGKQVLCVGSNILY